MIVHIKVYLVSCVFDDGQQVQKGKHIMRFI